MVDFLNMTECLKKILRLKYSCKNITIFIKSVVVSVVLCAMSANALSNDSRFCSDLNYKNTMHESWASVLPVLEKNNLSKAEVHLNIYNAQVFTTNFLRYAFTYREMERIDELLSFYLKYYDRLSRQNSYTFIYYPDISKKTQISYLAESIVLWSENGSASQTQENLLSSSQFIYLLSFAISEIVDTSQNENSTVVREFLDKYIDVVISHIKRWVLGIPHQGSFIGPFQRRAWGCKASKPSKNETALSHKQLIEKLVVKHFKQGSSKKLCNSITDTDLWVIAATANILYANLKDSSRLSLLQNEHVQLTEYLDTAISLLESRITIGTTRNFSGDTVTVASFDIGAVDELDTHRFANCDMIMNVRKFDDHVECEKPKNLSWDISHSSRLVHVFSSLRRYTLTQEKEFPSEMLMQSFADSFTYRVFNGDLENPLFSNYMDGRNGWYRVRYNNRDGFGVGPSDLSVRALSGGFAGWSKYNEELRAVFHRLYMILSSGEPKHFIDEHYNKTYWQNYERQPSFDFPEVNTTASKLVQLQFYSSFCMGIH